jgi:transcriptional regulator EpsA
MSPSISLPEVDPAHFLKIAGQGVVVQTHADLWRWLQGDVQQCLPHEVMMIGWGDFRTGELHHDLVSSVPGVRSHSCARAAMGPLISYFRDCWVAAQHLPCQVDMKDGAELLGRSGEGWTTTPAIAGMRSALVHGIGDGRRSGERIFAALSSEPYPPPNAANALKLLVPFIDTALRQMPPAPDARPPSARPPVEAHMAKLTALSERERQIMVWVAMGKTNPEIGCILNISEFTVKNHMKSIFGKLDVTNRAQAVAKLTRISTYA